MGDVLGRFVSIKNRLMSEDPYPWPLDIKLKGLNSIFRGLQIRAI